jgi:hypothetical protein
MAIKSGTKERIELSLDALAEGFPGITPIFGQALSEAASVCLDQQGHSSPTSMTVRGALDVMAQISWHSPNDQARRCWADDQETTEQGAYGVASVLVPEISDFTVVERSKKGTGFDYWLGEKGEESLLFQGKARLEVSGIRSGSNTEAPHR